MATISLLPTDYAKHKKLKDKINTLSDVVIRKLQRFPYRYRFAKSFNQIEADTAIKTRTEITGCLLICLGEFVHKCRTRTSITRIQTRLNRVITSFAQNHHH